MKLMAGFSLCLALIAAPSSSAVLLRGGADSSLMKLNQTAESPLSRYGYAKDCTPAHKRQHSFSALEWKVALRAGKSLPGTGMDMDSIKPYKKVYKDGFYYVSCAKDVLFNNGDKHGDGKNDYNLKDISNVSIIHYTDVVPKTDREKVTHQVCFAFCRTLEHMNFFGIIGGTDCYCSPFFEEEPGDSSDCDASCDGDATTSCGGKTKSSLFEMHLCSSMAEDLETLQKSSDSASGKVSILGDASTALANGMQDAAAKEQEMWGAAGDPNAADLMQKTKVWAGDILKVAKPVSPESKTVNASVDDAKALKGKDFTDSDIVLEAEGVIENLETGSRKLKDLRKPLQKVYDAASRGLGEKEDLAGGYYSLMYFVDRKYLGAPSTCGGTWDGKTVFKAKVQDCASACDGEVVKPACVGFMLTESGLCFLFSKFKTVQYYTDCKEKAPPKGAFNATSMSDHTRCYAKLEDFQGTDLSPDPKGKNKLSLTEAKKADRCYK